MNFISALTHMAKYAGAFAASSRAAAGSLPILGYHAFSLGQGHHFRPKLFMRPELFAARLEFLRSEGFRVLPLEGALQLLEDGGLRRKDVVITIDDGFHSTAEIAIPLLRRYRYPATIYVTTYYVERNHPVFRLAVQYCFWRGSGQELDLAGLLPGAKSKVILGSPEAERVLWAIVGYGESCPTEDQRVLLTRELARRLDLSYADLTRSRRLTLMNEDQIAKASGSGIDIQLHTHRHRLPADVALLAREIKQNRSVLEPIVGRRLRHLCYPSNVWTKSQWPALAASGVETATTCDPGMNRKETTRLALHRFMDDNTVPQIRFEAELHGLGDLWRSLSGRERPSHGAGQTLPIAEEPFLPESPLDLSDLGLSSGQGSRSREDLVIEPEVAVHHAIQAEQAFRADSSRRSMRAP